VRTHVWVETEVEVDVPVESIIDAIMELETPDRVDMATTGISSCYAFLRRVPDEIIAAMNDKQRGIIGAALKEQAERYAAPSGRNSE